MNNNNLFLDIDYFVTKMIERAYSLMVETERVNQSASGGGIRRRGMRGGHHLTKVKKNLHCLLKKISSEGHMRYCML